MKRRLTALALAGVMLLALAACGARTPEEVSPSPEISDLPSEEVAATAGATEGVETETPQVSAEPSESATPSESPADESAQPSPTPSAIGDPTAPPSEEPAKAPTAAEVYAAVSAAAGVSYDNTTDYIDAFYTTLSTGDLDDYVLYMPPMSTQIEEVFIAKVKSGKMDAVKAACRDRQAAMAEEAAFYGTTGAYVDGYQLVDQGDWVLFCVCEKASGAVSTFRSSVK